MPTTYFAGDVTLVAVSGACASGSNGDTVIVPAGSGQWLQSLKPGKALTLLTAFGTGNTRISGDNINLIDWSSPVDQLIRISGFFFADTGYKSSIVVNGLVRINGASGSTQPGQSPLTQVRVDHNHFLYGTRALSTCGVCYGVADHNTFVNPNIAWGPFGYNTEAWKQPQVLGGSGAFFFETNTVIMNNGIPNGANVNESVYLSEGCRAVVRYNIFDWSGYYKDLSDPFDSHGNYVIQSTDPLSARGQPTYEIYLNTGRFNGYFRAWYLRGGLNVAWSNTVTSTGSVGDLFQLSEEDGWATNVSNPLMTSWPGRDQPMLFTWNNKVNGTINQNVGKNQSPGPDDVFIISGRDWFANLPTGGEVYYSFTGGLPPGTGYITFPITGYSPLFYPHPLANDSIQGGPPVSGYAVFQRFGPHLKFFVLR